MKGIRYDKDLYQTILNAYHRNKEYVEKRGKPGEWAMASEMCGVDAMIPERDRSLDFMPMREHTIIVPPDRQEYQIWSQFDQFPLPQAA